MSYVHQCPHYRLQRQTDRKRALCISGNSHITRGNYVQLCVDHLRESAPECALRFMIGAAATAGMTSMQSTMSFRKDHAHEVMGIERAFEEPVVMQAFAARILHLWPFPD